jgi:hypothetical protein
MLRHAQWLAAVHLGNRPLTAQAALLGGRTIMRSAERANNSSVVLARGTRRYTTARMALHEYLCVYSETYCWVQQSVRGQFTAISS